MHYHGELFSTGDALETVHRPGSELDWGGNPEYGIGHKNGKKGTEEKAER